MLVKKILIIGISGTGKSAMGRKLAEKTGLPLHHMDAIIWSPDWVETLEAPIRAAIAEIAAVNQWIVEGWIDAYSQPLLEGAEAIIYLDYPGWLAAVGGL